ncbi:MAG: hypothetical protein ACE5GY_06280 [Thermodesulfobacteriota bacterium]
MDCCSPANITIDADSCPECGARGQSVKVRTIKHWLVTPLVPGLPSLPFYFCRTGGCPVVYFSGDGSARYTKGEVRYPVGRKEGEGPATVCFCFGVTDEMVHTEVRETGKSTYSAWIATEVKDGNCACDVRNPSGRCCLKEVKRVESVYTGKEEGK